LKIKEDMNVTELYLGFGSNEGDRADNIRKGMALMDEMLGIRHKMISDMMEFEAWKFKGSKFLNCVVLYRIPDAGQDSTLYCLSVLRCCKLVEKKLGRLEVSDFDRMGNKIYHDRPIDIDILLYGANSVSTQELTVPHALASERDFVKLPLRQIASYGIKMTFPWIMK